jgi:hypothetical protein
VLAELAIAQAALAGVKEVLQHSGDIMGAAQHLASFFDSKAALQKKVNEKGGNKSDLQEWMALQQIAEAEEALKQHMVYLGKPGAWDSWLQFQADAKRRRDDEAKAIALAAYKRKQTIWAWINGFIIVAAVVTGLVAVAAVVWLIVTKGGNG